MAELRAAEQPLWDAVAVLEASQRLSLRVRQLCPGVGPVLRVSLSAWLQPAFFAPDAPPAVAAARAALLGSLGPSRPGPLAQVSAEPALAAHARGSRDGGADWQADECKGLMDWQAGATPPDEPGLRDLVYGLMRPLSQVAEATEPAGALPPYRSCCGRLCMFCACSSACMKVADSAAVLLLAVSGASCAHVDML